MKPRLTQLALRLMDGPAFVDARGRLRAIHAPKRALEGPDRVKECSTRFTVIAYVPFRSTGAAAQISQSVGLDTHRRQRIGLALGSGLPSGLRSEWFLGHRKRTCSTNVEQTPPGAA